MNLIWLTDWEDGSDVCVDPDAIRSMRWLSPETHDDFDDSPPQELGGRTRIDTATDMFLVRETPKEIAALTGHLREMP